MSNERSQRREKPLTTADELNQRVREMMAERQRQDEEFRARLSSGSRPAPDFFQPVIDKPLTVAELNQRVAEMMAERERQEAEFRAKLSSRNQP